MKYIRNPWIVGILVVIVIIGAYVKLKPSGADIETVLVQEGTVTDVVSVTGNVKATKRADLGFERTGRMAHIYRAVGDHVKTGDAIIALSNNDLQASLRITEANLAQAVRGTRSEELIWGNSKVQSSKSTYQNTKTALQSSLRQAYATLDDAVRNKADGVFKDPRSPNPQFTYAISTKNSQIDINSERSLVENKLIELQKNVSSLSEATIESVGRSAQDTASYAKSFLDDLSLLVNDLTPIGALTQTTIDSFKTDIGSARTNVNSTLSSLVSAQGSFDSAVSSLSVSQNEYNVSLAGSTNEDIEVAKAKVDQARAELEKTIIRAPFDGLVTRQDAVLGQIASANERVATVLDDTNFEIEARIPEVDIGRISLTDPVEIKLDAFPGKIFKGKVIYIEPSETIEGGVVNFKIKAAFNEKDSSIRTGLTANLDIETERKSSVLVLPSVAVIEDDKGAHVKKMVGGKAIETEVTLSIRSPNGFIEITSGLSDGDIVQKIGLKNSP